MKLELVVDGQLVAEFDGSAEKALHFQAKTFQSMAEAQSELSNAKNERSCKKFSALHEMNFGSLKTVPKDHQQADLKS